MDNRCTTICLQETNYTDDMATSLLALAVVKDSRSWGTDRQFVDFLHLLTNLTQQTPNVKLSLGLLVSDMSTYLDLG